MKIMTRKLSIRIALLKPASIALVMVCLNKHVSR